MPGSAPTSCSNKEQYEILHPTGPKHNSAYHTEAMDRAMEGGIDDVGIGVLFGLDNYAYEFAGLLMHAEHLEAVHGVGPHTISVPRVKPADDIDPGDFDNSLSDEMFCKIAACIRIAVPYTGMIISTRETPEVREKIIRLGVSQISGGSRTSVGGYAEKERPHDTADPELLSPECADDTEGIPDRLRIGRYEEDRRRSDRKRDRYDPEGESPRDRQRASRQDR